MTTTRRARVAVAVLALLGSAVMALAGCTGVPSDSSPQVIKTIPIGGDDGRVAATTPAPGTPPNTLVSDFLQANALDASQQTSPRGFLSPAARNNWSDTSVTVVDSPSVGFYKPQRGTVVVTARVVGGVNAAGVYSPYLPGAKNPPQQFSYGVRQLHGQYRITSLPNGLLLSENDFQSYYTLHPVYFYDLAHHYLVPDPRWTPLTDPTQLADFLMTGLTTEPSVGIQNDVSDDTLPARATAGRINVSLGTVTKIEIPGASQLSTTGRDRLAEQVAATLDGVGRIDRMEITDGGKAVTIPSVHGRHFGASDFADSTGPPAPPSEVYFLRGNGVIFDQDVRRLKGPANGKYFLQSIAVAQDLQLNTLSIAATVAASPQERLLVGTQSGGLRTTTVRGQLTRPAFAPGRSEVWIGDGDAVYVVSVDNPAMTQSVTRALLPSDAGDSQVVALRLSPDGSRIALVLRSPGGAQQLFVGAVIRTPGQVSIGQLQPVSPAGVVIQDVAWVEPLKLLAIGYDQSTLDHHLYTVGADGSLFGSQGLGNLPNSPKTLAVAVHQAPWVTANGAVWEQGLSNLWLNPGPGAQTDGYGAVYLG